jgi:hypothetical protein
MVLVAMLVVSGTVLIDFARARDSSGAPSGKIVAELAEPDTHFTLEVYDPDGDDLTVDWYPFFDCGWLYPESSAFQATWKHPDDGSQQGCSHDQGSSHNGSVLVTIDDETGNRIECRYEGSLSGEEPCAGAQSSPSPGQSPSPSPGQSPSPSPTPSPGESGAVTCPGFAKSSKDQVVGTNGPDVLRGGDSPEVICGLGGDDLVAGAGGADLLLGGAGGDDLRGGPGADRLRGGKGRDRCRGGAGDDADARSCESLD